MCDELFAEIEFRDARNSFLVGRLCGQLTLLRSVCPSAICLNLWTTRHRPLRVVE